MPKEPIEKKCNCGSWPDPSWTKDMFKAKAEAQKKCPVHGDKSIEEIIKIIDNGIIKMAFQDYEFGLKDTPMIKKAREITK